MATLRLDTNGTGLSVTLRISKSSGEEIRLVPEGTPGATVMAVKRVDELGWYSMGLSQLAEKLGTSKPKTLAIIRHLRIQEDLDCFKEIRVTAKQIFKRYSPKALEI